tara:strand:+ start:6934 stop:7488 length:555 start_codon:yes stop_codon:yes gene_type:complete
MNEACKLDIDLDISCLDGVNLPLFRKITRHQKYSKQQGTKYNLLPMDVLLMPGSRSSDYIVSQLPKSLLQHEVPELSVLEVTAPIDKDSFLAIHRDLARVAAINYYIDSDEEEVTSFFDWDDETNTATEKSNFIAKTDETWLLNVSELHSVKIKAGHTRRILSMSFTRTNYETIRGLCASKVHQ